MTVELAVAFAAGFTLATILALIVIRRRGRIADRAATQALDEMRTAQQHADRTTLAHLPPLVTATDALDLAARRGITLQEAAWALFHAAVHARIQANLRRHRGTRR